MAVTHKDILAWLQQASDDFDGVVTAIDLLDPDEARDTVKVLLALLRGLTASQEVHRLAIQRTFDANPDLPSDDVAGVLLGSLNEMYWAIPGLRALMRVMEESPGS